jgi:hypothetical protein
MFCCCWDPLTDICLSKIWECDPIGLMLHGRGYHSVSRLDEHTHILHIYISRNHPNIAEAILHGFFQMLGYPHTLCVVLELLARKKQPNEENGAEDTWFMLPERFIFQIKNSSYDELAKFIHQTQKVQQVCLPFDTLFGLI